jgi:hypothetical protein
MYAGGFSYLCYHPFTWHFAETKARGIYRSAPTRAKGATEVLWGELGANERRESTAPANTFDCPPSWTRARTLKIRMMTELLNAVAEGRVPSQKSKHSHYDMHVGDLVPEAIRPLASRLGRYLEDIE